MSNPVVDDFDGIIIDDHENFSDEEMDDNDGVVEASSSNAVAAAATNPPSTSRLPEKSAASPSHQRLGRKRPRSDDDHDEVSRPTPPVPIPSAQRFSSVVNTSEISVTSNFDIDSIRTCGVCFNLLTTGRCQRSDNGCSFSHVILSTVVSLYAKIVREVPFHRLPNFLKPPEESIKNKEDALVHIYHTHKHTLMASENRLDFLVDVLNDLKGNPHYVSRFEKVNEFTNELYEMFPHGIFNMPEAQIAILNQICEHILDIAIDWTQSGIDQDRALSCLTNINYFLFLKGLVSRDFMRYKSVLDVFISLNLLPRVAEFLDYFSHLPNFKVDSKYLDVLIKDIAKRRNLVNLDKICRILMTLSTVELSDIKHLIQSFIPVCRKNLTQSHFARLLWNQLTEIGLPGLNVERLVANNFSDEVLDQIPIFILNRQWDWLGDHLHRRVQLHDIEKVRRFFMKVFEYLVAIVAANPPTLQDQTKLTASEIFQGFYSGYSKCNQPALLPLPKIFFNQLTATTIHFLYRLNPAQSILVFKFAASQKLEPWTTETLSNPTSFCKLIRIPISKANVLFISCATTMRFNTALTARLVWKFFEEIKSNFAAINIFNIIRPLLNSLIDACRGMKNYADKTLLLMCIKFYSDLLAPVLHQPLHNLSCEVHERQNIANEIFNKIVREGIVSFKAKKDLSFLTHMSVFIDLNIEGSPDRNRMLASLEPALVRALTFIHISNKKVEKATKFYRYGIILGDVYKDYVFTNTSATMYLHPHMTQEEMEFAVGHTLVCFKKFMTTNYSNISEELRNFDVVVVGPEVAPTETGFSFLDCVFNSTVREAISRAEKAASPFSKQIQKGGENSIHLSMKTVMDLFKRSNSCKFQISGASAAPQTS